MGRNAIVQLLLETIGGGIVRRRIVIVVIDVVRTIDILASVTFHMKNKRMNRILYYIIILLFLMDTTY